MSQSPSKRQRISVDTFISRSNGDGTATVQSNSTTPTRRASYLSPTKASLARSYSKLLTKSPGRAATEPRRPHTTGDTGSELSLTGLQEGDQAHASTEAQILDLNASDARSIQARDARSGSNLAIAIAQAFKDVPSRSVVSDTNQRVPRSDRIPLSPSQPRATSRPAEERQMYEKERSEPILPKLVKQSNSSSQSQDRNNEDDMELPPTPVQLGLTGAPYRPRGLASSSSGGSRSGSGKNRRRTRNNESRSITSSPLKPRAPAQAAISQANFAAQNSKGEPEEAHESNLDEDRAPRQAGLYIEAREKQKELLDLQAELASLRVDLERLEVLSQSLTTDQDVELGNDVQQLLAGSGQLFNAKQNSQESHPSLLKDPNAFLTLFAPADLQLSHSSETKLVQKQPKVIHRFTITPPKPWPASVLYMIFKVTIDATSASIESIQLENPVFVGQHAVLLRWVEQRLAHPLHRYDATGLVHGVGEYFNACVARARTLHTLSNRYGSKLHDISRISTANRLDAKDAMALARYLDDNQIMFTIPSGSTRIDTSSEKQILLSYDIILTWTGSAETAVQLTCQHVGPKAQRGAKDLFQKLLLSEGVVDAFERVWKLFDHDSSDATNRHSTQPKRGRKRAAVS